MSIIFGTDFSQPATKAAWAAATLASGWHEPLILVHVADTGDPGSLLGKEPVPLKPLKGQLREEAARLRELGGEVHEELLSGIPDEALVEFAEKSGARLIVLSALGRRSGTWWRLGSTADRVAQTSKVPVLVVRNAAGFEAWSQGQRPLKVVLGFDFSTSSEAAVTWLGQLREFRPCDVVATNIYWPPAEYSRLGIRGPMDLARTEPHIEKVLLRDMERGLSQLGGAGELRYQVLFSFGRVADSLTSFAEREQPDLVVVGTHQRKGLAKVWHGSVAQGVLHHAPCSVVVVPDGSAKHQQVPVPVRRVLVPTDLSELGNQAVPHAYSVIPSGGIVHLLYVVEERLTGERLEQTHQSLRAAIPSTVAEHAEVRGIRTQTEVVDGPDPARVICQAAERLGADLICMASHGRSGMLQTLVGSVAQEVLRASRRPVLLIRAPFES